jgi:predicted NBD/HSP70 family sugar kinase
MKARVAADLKEFNRMLVYRLVKSRASISRTEISRRLGLSVPTVIKIIEYFTGLGLIGNVGEGESPLGRKPMLLSACAKAAYAVGAEYDGVHLSVGLVDLAGKVVALRRSPAPPDLALSLGRLLADEVESLIAGSGLSSGLVKGIGVGVPGVVHGTERYISQAPLVGVEEKVEYGALASQLSDRLGLPVHVANDANAAALGELSARGTHSGGDLIFVELGRGVGAGLVLDGRLREGPGCSAGEIGYMVFDRSASCPANADASKPRRKSAGPGWLETSMDLTAFWAEVEKNGSPGADTIRRVCHPLALGLANLCIALDIRNIVLGREGKESFGPALLDCLRGELERLCPMEVSCELSLAAEPGVVGAAGIATDEWLKTVCAG